MFLSTEQKAELEATCVHLAQAGKGISACDESTRTINPRFEKVGVEPTEERRRAYRQLLFEAPGSSEFLTGAILDPETVYQKSSTDGRTFPAVLKSLGILPGVKPSLTVYKLPGTGGETVMQGLDSLSLRAAEYRAAGCLFAKWRSPLTIDTASGKPSELAIESNCRDLARYALICQSEGLVPLVEPDVVLKGEHTLETAVEVNGRVHAALFKAMADHDVYMEGALFKVNMVCPGKDCPVAYSVDDIATANLLVLRRSLPVAIRSVNFLSGGQSLEACAARLNAMNQLKQKRGACSAPWNLSFSWSACVQLPLFDLCLTEDYSGDEAGFPRAAMQALYLNNLSVAASAASGTHTPAPGDGDHKPAGKPKKDAAAEGESEAKKRKVVA